MKYYVNGFAPPDDVSGTDDVKRYQRLLGVTVDGLWGKNTQSAYEAYTRAGAHKNAQAQIPEGFGDTVDWDSVTKQVSEYLSNLLRPSVDAAIAERKRANGIDRAEIDADAQARGMGASTYSSSLKARADADTASDIADMESSYSSALAGEVYDALSELREQQAERERFEAEQALEREKLAQEQEQFEASLAAASRGGNGGAGDTDDIARPINGKRTYQEYFQFLSQLDEGVSDLFTSDSLYWETLRQCIMDDLGEAQYYQLMDRLLRDDGTYGSSHYVYTGNESKEKRPKRDWRDGKYSGFAATEQ